MNVISPLEGMAAAIKHDLVALGPEHFDRVTRDVDSIEWSELAGYQERRSKAHAAGLLTAIDAEWLRAVLGGEDPPLEKWKEQPIEKRLLALKILLDVMQRLPPCAARDVAPGRSWAFRSHRALAAFPSIKSVQAIRSARTADR